MPQCFPYIHFILPAHIFVLKTSETHETKIFSTCDLYWDKNFSGYTCPKSLSQKAT